MPTKRKGASKHRQSRRSRRHSRRSVRGAGKLSNIFKFKSNKSSLSGITNPSFPTLEPSHAGTRVEVPFEFIGDPIRTDLLRYTGYIQMKDGKKHYMPGGFVLWGGDNTSSKIGGWFQVKKFNPITNMPEGRAYRVRSPETPPVRIKDSSGRDDFEVFDLVAKSSGVAPAWIY